jgi:hypothetical protein
MSILFWAKVIYNMLRDDDIVEGEGKKKEKVATK